LTPDEALKVLSVLTAAYPNVNIPEETAQIYVKFLLDLPYEAGKAAALSLIAESKYFPTIAELRQAALAVSGNDLPSPGEAWGEVVAQMKEAGIYRRPRFSHPVIEKAVQAIGWQELCLSENQIADRVHFMRIYESYAERARQEAIQIPEVRQLVKKLSGAKQDALPMSASEILTYALSIGPLKPEEEVRE